MKDKKSYVKPEIVKVELTPEEAVLAHCKSSTGTHKKAGYCRSISSCPPSTTGKTIGS